MINQIAFLIANSLHWFTAHMAYVTLTKQTQVILKSPEKTKEFFQNEKKNLKRPQ